MLTPLPPSPLTPQRTREYEDLVAAARFLRCVSLRLVPCPDGLAPHFRVLWRGGRYEVVYFFRPIVGAAHTAWWAASEQVAPPALPWSLLPSSVQKGAPLRLRPFVVAKGVRAASPRGGPGVAQAAQAALARDRANGVAVTSLRAHVDRCTAALRGYEDAVARSSADDASPAARADAAAAAAVASELSADGCWEGVREALEEGGSDILPEVSAVASRLGAGKVTLSRTGMDECVPGNPLLPYRRRTRSLPRSPRRPALANTLEQAIGLREGAAVDGDAFLPLVAALRTDGVHQRRLLECTGSPQLSLRPADLASLSELYVPPEGCTTSA